MEDHDRSPPFPELAGAVFDVVSARPITPCDKSNGEMAQKQHIRLMEMHGALPVINGKKKKDLESLLPEAADFSGISSSTVVAAPVLYEDSSSFDSSDDDGAERFVTPPFVTVGNESRRCLCRCNTRRTKCLACLIALIFIIIAFAITIYLLKPDLLNKVF
jgi:hypothetical protein